jgi:glycosyltransferase involved in cell wall biosynthesis
VTSRGEASGLRVAFDGRPATDRRGIGRYASALRGALECHAHRHGGEITDTHRPRRHDVFHAPWIEGAPLRPRVPTVVTLHDLHPFKRAGELLRAGLGARMRSLAVSRATRVIVPTRVVAGEAHALLGVGEEQVHVVPEAADAAFYPRSQMQVSALCERHGIPADYLLWVGGLRHPEPRKRVAALAQAPRELPLVLAGEAGQWARELPNVILTGGLGDDELAALYTGARALVYPSGDEGFGLPPVEALACGTPVVACELPALREVLGDRVSYVEAGDLAALFDLAQAARRPAPAPPAWSWADAAAATWRVYEHAVADAPAAG